MARSTRFLRTPLLVTAPIALALASVILPAAPASADSPVNLRWRGVFSQSNAADGNQVVAYSRGRDGKLTRVGDFPTGGTGSGGFEDSANGVVLASSKGEVSPNNNIAHGNLLFVTNAGSDTISVFKVRREGLKRVELQPSGGEKPVSVTVNDGVLYVLNSNETVDGLVPPNCAEAVPSISGFRVGDHGRLSPIPGSTRMLSENSGCAQVSFNPAGTVLVVTERTARTDGQATDDEGIINTFRVRDDGRLGLRRVYDATSSGPFGFTFSKDGDLLTSEQNDGLEGPGRGSAAGYRLDDDGRLMPAGPSAPNGGTDSCWFVVTDNGRYGFVTSFFGDGQISSYRVAGDGSLRLLEAAADDGAANAGASDLSLSRNSRYLYQLNSFEGTIVAYRVGRHGGLTQIDVEQAHSPSPMMAAPLGIAAS